MNPDNLLSQLRDAHAPEPFGLWPLAPGWWILILLSLLGLVALIYFSLKYWRTNLWRREAKHEFKRCRERYLNQPSRAHLIDLNQLLKRILSTAKTNRQFMHYVESDWARELSAIEHKGVPVLEEREIQILSTGLYRPEPEILDEAALQRLERWIKKVR